MHLITINEVRTFEINGRMLMLHLIVISDFETGFWWSEWGKKICQLKNIRLYLVVIKVCPF